MSCHVKVGILKSALGCLGLGLSGGSKLYLVRVRDLPTGRSDRRSDVRAAAIRQTLVCFRLLVLSPVERGTIQKQLGCFRTFWRGKGGTRGHIIAVVAKKRKVSSKPPGTQPN